MYLFRRAGPTERRRRPPSPLPRPAAAAGSQPPAGWLPPPPPPFRRPLSRQWPAPLPPAPFLSHCQAHSATTTIPTTTTTAATTTTAPADTQAEIASSGPRRPRRGASHVCVWGWAWQRPGRVWRNSGRGKERVGRYEGSRPAGRRTNAGVAARSVRFHRRLDGRGGVGAGDAKSRALVWAGVDWVQQRVGRRRAPSRVGDAVTVTSRANLKSSAVKRLAGHRRSISPLTGPIPTFQTETSSIRVQDSNRDRKIQRDSKSTWY